MATSETQIDHRTTTPRAAHCQRNRMASAESTSKISEGGVPMSDTISVNAVPGSPGLTKGRTLSQTSASAAFGVRRPLRKDVDFSKLPNLIFLKLEYNFRYGLVFMLGVDNLL